MVQNDVHDTIVAQATPRGRGGVGVIRVSGPQTTQIAEHILRKIPKIRIAEYLDFLDTEGALLDQGIALFFKGPHSFTGEDVLELQGHGGPVVMDALMRAVMSFGARVAQPGEFSLRAFLNNKMDLVQAEAVSDLINASTSEAARGAMRSLQGVFSKQVEDVVQSLIDLRMFVEAAIDFPEEEIDFLSDGKVEEKLKILLSKTQTLFQKTKQARLISEGVKIVLMGQPNAGKSSLLNCLAGFDAAIVTDIPGTTRDVLKEQISIDGLLVQFVDTAGLREEADVVEAEGIRRAFKEAECADHIVLVVDGFSETLSLGELFFPKTFQNNIFSRSLNSLRSNSSPSKNIILKSLGTEVKKTILCNKIDKMGVSARIEKKEDYTIVYASAKTGEGIDLFREHIKEVVGFSEGTEGNFVARRRHLEALLEAEKHLLEGRAQLNVFKAGELLAEELRLAQLALESITGKFTSDDLLGKIFSEFCIGK